MQNKSHESVAAQSVAEPGSPSLSICLVSAAYHPYPSGVSEHVSRLAIGLSRLGQRVEVLTTRYPNLQVDGDDPIAVTRIGRAISVPGNGSRATLPVGLRMPSQVRRFLFERRFDVVHCHGFLWPEISYWAIRHSGTLNVVSLMSAPQRQITAGSALFRRLFAQELEQMAGTIAISARAWSAFEPYIGGECRIIPCGVDQDIYKPGLRPLPEADSDAPTILFVGRLDRRKGVRVVISAMPRVLQSFPRARLVVAGDGPEMEAARRDTVQLRLDRSVQFVGRASAADLPLYYAGCDVFCSPALGGEAQGIVLVEAMSSGAAVVASRIPGYDETVRHEVDGLLFQPGDADALADCIGRVLGDGALRERLVGEAAKRVAERYAMPVVAGRTLDYYRDLLSERQIR